MAKKYLSIEDDKLSRMVFIMCWIAYFSTYLGRLNFSAVMPSIIGDALMTKAQAGLISTAFFACYGFGQFFCGFLGDRLSPFLMVFIGVGISAAANISMYFCPGFASMTVMWGINGLSQSMIWSSVLRILSQVMPERARGRACVHINSTVALGTLCSYLLSTLSIKLWGWRYAFLAAAVAMAAAVLFWAWEWHNLSPKLTLVELAPTPEKKTGGGKKLLPMLLTSGCLLLLFPTAIHGALKDGITTWVPTYLSESFMLSPDFAVLLSVALPIFNVTGAYFVDILNRKLIHDDILSAGACFAICGVSLLGLRLFGSVSPILSVILLAVATSMMLGANVMFITFIPVYFGKYGKASTVTGILNSAAYIGCAGSMLLFGSLSEQVGWSGTISVWIGLSAVAIFLCVLGYKPWQKFKEE